MQSNADLVLSGTQQLHSAVDIAQAVADLKKAATVMPEKGKAWDDEATYEVMKKALEGYRDELPERMRLFTEEADGLADAVAVGQRFLRVASAAAGAYAARKRRAGALDFDDLLVLGRDLLRDSAEARSAVQGRYSFVLIDELQDTDPVQMELVRHLCGPGLHFGKLFTVGDHKQSIYRFRGGGCRVVSGATRRGVGRRPAGADGQFSLAGGGAGLLQCAVLSADWRV